MQKSFIFPRENYKNDSIFFVRYKGHARREGNSKLKKNKTKKQKDKNLRQKEYIAETTITSGSVNGSSLGWK